jgi:hypothetical protein
MSELIYARYTRRYKGDAIRYGEEDPATSQVFQRIILSSLELQGSFEVYSLCYISPVLLFVNYSRPNF